MHKRIVRSTIWILLLLALAFGVKTLPAFAQETPVTGDESVVLLQPLPTPDSPFVPGHVVVGLYGDVAASAASLGAETWSGIDVLGIEPLDLRTGEASAAGDGATQPLAGYLLTVPEGMELAAVDTLKAQRDVAFAEPDWLAQIAQSEAESASSEAEIAQSEPDVAITEAPFVVNDPLYPDQWYMQRIGMSRAWAVAVSQAAQSTTHVYILDTGADLTHPDLVGKLVSGHNYVNSAAEPFDDNGHGTHIAGLVAAAANGSGMVGPGLNVDITPFKVLSANGTGGVSTIGQAIRDAADQGADIINMSLEISFDTFPLRSAVQYAVSKGVLILAAAGNAGSLAVSYPAAYPEVIAVGASTYSDARATYSNQGTDLDIVAPGGQGARPILSTWTSASTAICPQGLSKVNGGFYCELDGTSMATGIASGVAALIKSLRPDLDADEIQTILLDSAAPLNALPTAVGRGRLDAAKAIRMAFPPALFYDSNGFSAAVQQGSAPVTVTLTFDNPSLVPMSVEMTPTITTTWYSLVGPREGEVSYGEPLAVQVVFTPTAIVTGTVQSSIRLTATVDGKVAKIISIPTRLQAFPLMVGNTRMYVPWATMKAATFEWAEPDSGGRNTYAISETDSIVVDLPFALAMGERDFTDLRIFGDGFAVGSASALPDTLPNLCLANQLFPPFAVYGWWSALDVGINSELSTFQSDDDHFVIEYNDFLKTGSIDPDDSVTFQIVLARDGQIRLNYEHVPEHLPTGVTVGASRDDGRFYNQIACRSAGTVQLGELPAGHQSFLLTPGDLY